MADNTGRRNSRTRAVAHSAEHPASLSISEAIETSALAVPIAIDDGHSTTKVAFLSEGTRGELLTASFPSRTIVGLQEYEAEGTAGADAYFFGETAAEASGGARNILSIGGSVGAMPMTDNRTSDYPISPRNRVLVHHALRQALASLPWAREPAFRIGTTLPYGDFNLPKGGHNSQLIAAKKASLAKPVYPMDKATLQPIPPGYSIAAHDVFSEGVAAFFDSMLGVGADGQVFLDETFARRFDPSLPNFVVVDIGGKTVDVVYGTWSGGERDIPRINVAWSESITMGALDAADELAHAIRRRFEVRNVVDPEGALQRRSYRLHGQAHDISQECDAAVRPLFSRIRDAVLRHSEDGSALAAILFVGGGSVLLEQQVRTMFNPAQVHVPPAPSFANARGILKLLLTATE